MAQLNGYELQTKICQLETDGCEFFPTEDEIKSYIWRTNRISNHECIREQEQQCSVYRLVSLYDGKIYYYKDVIPEVKVFTRTQSGRNLLMPTFDQAISNLTAKGFVKHVEVLKSIGEAKYSTYSNCFVNENSIFLYFLYVQYDE